MRTVIGLWWQGLILGCSGDSPTERATLTYVTPVEEGFVQSILADGEGFADPALCVTETGAVHVVWSEWPTNADPLHTVFSRTSPQRGAPNTWSDVAMVGRGENVFEYDMDCTSEGLFVAWSTQRRLEGLVHDVYVRRAIDGVNFAPETLLQRTTAGGATYPSTMLRAKGSHAVASWLDVTDSQLFTASTQDAGASWSGPRLVSASLKPDRQNIAPSLALSSTGSAVLAWTSWGLEPPSAHVAHSIDYGNSFAGPSEVQTDPESAFEHVLVCADGSNVALVWASSLPSTTSVLNVIRSSNGGASWSVPEQVLDPFEGGALPAFDCVVEGDVLHIAGQRRDNSGPESIWYGRTAPGEPFAAIPVSSDEQRSRREPRLAVRGGQVVVAWLDGNVNYNDEEGAAPFFSAFSSQFMPATVQQQPVELEGPPTWRTSLQIELQGGLAYLVWSEGDSFENVGFARFTTVSP